jgi:hypothetical protein
MGASVIRGAGTDVEALVFTVIATMVVLLAEFGVGMRGVLVTVSLAVLVVNGSAGTIRVVVGSAIVALSVSAEGGTKVATGRAAIATIATIAVSTIWASVVIEVELLMGASVIRGTATNGELLVFDVITTMVVLLTEFGVGMRGVLVTVGLAVLIVNGSAGTIRVVAIATIATIATVVAVRAAGREVAVGVEGLGGVLSTEKSGEASAGVVVAVRLGTVGWGSVGLATVGLLTVGLLGSVGLATVGLLTVGLLTVGLLGSVGVTVSTTVTGMSLSDGSEGEESKGLVHW